MRYSTEVLICDSQVVSSDGRQWTPWKRWTWLEKIARKCWLMFSEKGKCRVPGYKRVVVEHDKILELCREAMNKFRRLQDIPRHIVMGPRQFGDAMLEFDGKMISFGVDWTLRDIREIKVLGMTVHVVPWFDGILLLPDLDPKEPYHG